VIHRIELYLHPGEEHRFGRTGGGNNPQAVPEAKARRRGRGRETVLPYYLHLTVRRTNVVRGPSPAKGDCPSGAVPGGGGGGKIGRALSQNRPVAPPIQIILPEVKETRQPRHVAKRAGALTDRTVS